MKEKDWKIFKKIKDEAIDEFCKRSLNEFREIIDNEEEHIHNRYLYLSKLVRNHDKQMSLLFDGHSRSKAWLQLLAIRKEGLANESLLEQISKEFEERTNPEKIGF